MISIDRKVCRDILAVTSNYSDWILYDPALNGYCFWDGTHPERPSFVSSVVTQETQSALLRIEDAGLIKRMKGITGGGLIFHITAELLHRKAFFFDAITRRFLWGFIAGVSSTLIPQLIYFFITTR